MTSRPLTARDRAPRPGDVLRRGRARIEIRAAQGEYSPYLVHNGMGLTRMGMTHLRGIPHPAETSFWIETLDDGFAYWTADGTSYSSVQRPYVYLSRKDRGCLSVPVDAGVSA